MATVQPPVAALTQPPCRAVTFSGKINTKKAVKTEILAGPHGLTSRDWCVIKVGQLNKVITDVFCPACHSVGTLSVTKTGQRALGLSESLHLQCTNCQYKGGSVYSSPRLHDSAKLNVACADAEPEQNHVLFDKFSNSVTADSKMKIWENMSMRINASNDCAIRTCEEVKEKWTDWTSGIKMKNAKWKVSLRQRQPIPNWMYWQSLGKTPHMFLF